MAPLNNQEVLSRVFFLNSGCSNLVIRSLIVGNTVWHKFSWNLWCCRSGVERYITDQCVWVCVLCLDCAHHSDDYFLLLSFPPHSSAISSCQQHTDRHARWQTLFQNTLRLWLHPSQLFFFFFCPFNFFFHLHAFQLCAWLCSHRMTSPPRVFIFDPRHLQLQSGGSALLWNRTEL